MVKKMRKKDMYVVGIDVLIVLALIVWKKRVMDAFCGSWCDECNELL